MPQSYLFKWIGATIVAVTLLGLMIDSLASEAIAILVVVVTTLLCMAAMARISVVRGQHHQN